MIIAHVKVGELYVALQLSALFAVQVCRSAVPLRRERAQFAFGATVHGCVYNAAFLCQKTYGAVVFSERLY